MKVSCVILFILFLFLQVFPIAGAGIIDEYLLLKKGIDEFDSFDYQSALKIFRTIESRHHSSALCRSGLLNYYIGKVQFQLKNHTEAESRFSKTSYFTDEVQLLRGDCLMEMKQFKDAEKQFNKLISERFSVQQAEFEQAAFSRLVKIDSNYENYFKLRHQGDFKVMSRLSREQISRTGHYFINTGQYVSAIKCFEFLQIKKLQEEDLTGFVKSLFYSRQYSRITDLSKTLQKSVLDAAPEINYFIALAYKKEKNIQSALKYFNKVHSRSLKNTVEFEKGLLYFNTKKYKDALECFEQSLDARVVSYFLRCLEKLYDRKKSDDVLIQLTRHNPYHETRAEIRYELYKRTSDKKYLKAITEFHPGTYLYKIAAEKLKIEPTYKDFPLKEYASTYSTLLKKISALKELNFYEPIEIELEMADFKERDQLFKKYLKVKWLQDQKRFKEAYYLSAVNSFSFHQYRETSKFLYPDYYKAQVETSSKLYDLNPSLVYSLIMKESSFRQDIVSSASAYGLMQLLLPTARIFEKDVKFMELLDPDVNIRLGCRYLQYLNKKFEGNTMHVLAAYNGGEGNVRKWIKRFGRHFKVSQIPFYETRRYVSKILGWMYMYDTLYSKVQPE